MLGILLIFFIGKYYYDLAQDHHRNRWLFGVLGIVVYYAGSVIGGLIMRVLDGAFDLEFDWDNQLSLMGIALVSGLSFTVLVYYLLSRYWKKSKKEIKNEINDIGKTPEEN